MTEFLFSYGLFIAKIITALVALVLVVTILGSVRKKDDDSNLKVTDLNQKYKNLKQSLLVNLLDKKQLKKIQKEEQKENKQKKSKAEKLLQNSEYKNNLFVLEFSGDIKASGVDSLRDEVSAILSVAKPTDEVLIKLENAGGMVHGHGLAASQLNRLKQANLHCTVAVDMVAASGGYMMACVADKIIAAPFAILGSIGVLAQLPNFNRLLDKAGIDFEQHAAGEFKRNVTMFGKNSEKERKKLKQDLEETHILFQNFVSEHRPKLDIEKVATGEHWYGQQALDLNLVDELKTSDEFLIEALEHYQILEIKMEQKTGLQDKLLGGLFSSVDRVRDGLASKHNDSRYH